MRRKGFTLVEVLVILAIIAALAAVLVPTISNQVRRGDAGRVVSDMTNLRTGIEAFLVNVHRYPGDAEDLVTQINGSDTDVNGATYPSGLQSSWDGPYIDRVVEDAGTLRTGFGGLIQDEFTAVQYSGSNTTEYLTITILGIAESEFDLIDEEIDGTVSSTAGLLRWGTDGTTDTISYLAMPIN